MGGLYFGLYFDFVKTVLIVIRCSWVSLVILTTSLLYSVSQTVFAVPKALCRFPGYVFVPSGMYVVNLANVRT